MPPMRMTIVLEPISLPEKSFDEKSKSLFAFLENFFYEILMSFKELLMEMKLVENEYIQLIHCTLKQLTIFLK
jgi:hypothetical protein